MNPASPADNLQRLKLISGPLGVDLLSSARIDGGAGLEFHESVRGQAAGLPYAVVAGIALSPPILRTVVNAPTWTYYYHYRTVNFALDQAALAIAGECSRMGHEAFPVPASQILDWDRLRAHLSHREVAGLAGLGWRGRNNLLVNPEFGSQVRYVTVLTDLPLPGAAPGAKAGGCGDCRRCVAACPAGAIHDDPEDFNLDKCAAQLRRFVKSEKINAMICGLCVKACGGERAARKRGLQSD